MVQKNNHSIKKSYESITSPVLCKRARIPLLETRHPAQERVCSQCMLPMTLTINCWTYPNTGFSLHLTMCPCPSSHLHAGFFLPDHLRAHALQAPARHEPGISLCGSAPALTGAAKGNQLENHQHHCSKAKAALSRAGLWLWGSCITLGSLSGARRMSWVKCWSGAAPLGAVPDSPGHSCGLLQRLRDRSGAPTKAALGVSEQVCRGGFIHQCKKQTPNATAATHGCTPEDVPSWMLHFSTLTSLVRAEKAGF